MENMKQIVLNKFVSKMAVFEEVDQEPILYDTLKAICESIEERIDTSKTITDAMSATNSDHTNSLLFLLLKEIAHTFTQDQIDLFILRSAERYCHAGD